VALAPQSIDWSTLPAPEDDGAARHLTGMELPSVSLPSSTGQPIDLGAVEGRGVVYIYPMTGAPGAALPEDWDQIPGARGCSPQSCAFRDHFADLRALGVAFLFGVSAQSPAEQKEAAERLQLPFPLLSDGKLELARALQLPTFEAGGRTLLKRLTLILQGRRIEHVFYPVFPPDRNADDVLAWLQGRQA